MRPHGSSNHKTAATAAAAVILMGLLPACGPKAPPIDPHKTLLWQLRGSNVTVYPTVIVRGYGTMSLSTPATKSLIDYIKSRITTQVVRSEQRMESVTPLASQWKGQWQSAAQVIKAHIADHPIGTRFAMMAVYQVVAGAGPQSIHGFLVDARGDVVRRVEITRKDQDFKDAQPKTTDDCTRLLIKVLDRRLKIQETYAP